MGDGVKQAREAVDSGKAKRVLDTLIERSGQLASEAS
jgi:anthranilate phosphoribosyltransferase